MGSGPEYHNIAHLLLEVILGGGPRTPGVWALAPRVPLTRELAGASLKVTSLAAHTRAISPVRGEKQICFSASVDAFRLVPPEGGILRGVPRRFKTHCMGVLPLELTCLRLKRSTHVAELLSMIRQTVSIKLSARFVKGHLSDKAATCHCPVRAGPGSPPRKGQGGQGPFSGLGLGSPYVGGSWLRFFLT